MKLNIKAFALSMGIVWALLVFLYTWWIIVQDYIFYVGIPSGKVFLSYLYPYYTISPLGSLLGLVYGFVDGIIVGAGLAWLYNRFSRNRS